MKHIFFLLLLSAVYGCTYQSQSEDPVTPATYESTPYRSPESIGKLRRLALMPVEIQSYAGKQASAQDQQAAARSYQDTCADFLIDKKGYEVLSLRDGDDKWQGGSFETSENEELQTLYREWGQETAGRHSASVIRRLGAALNVDGVLVIQIKEQKPWGVTEGILNIALMNIPLFYKIASPNIGAWIYESVTGRLVWSIEHSTFGDETTTATQSLLGLFADLENAVPRQLTN